MKPMREETVLYQPETQNLKLIVINGSDIQETALAGEQALGRPSGGQIPAIAVRSGVVSRRHGRFLTGPGGCRYADAGSMNGTSCNGRMLEAGQWQQISEGDVLRIHGKQDENAEMDVILICAAAGQKRQVWNRISLARAAEVVIGRGERMQLYEKSVSRRHASLFHAKKGWAVIDHGSLNGVYLNAVRIEEPVYLRKYDVIRIAGYYFVFTGDELLCQADLPEADASRESLRNPVVFDTPAAAEKPVVSEIPAAVSYDPGQSVTENLQAADDTEGLSIWIEERNVWNRAKKKTLLRDIRLDIPSGSMVLILGGSGAGKTTFMNAVMGYERAEGEIRYAGTDIYREYERMKYEIGYVPQQDLLRMNDSVYDTLLNAAKMRLPVMSASGYVRHVEETLHLLGLERLRDSLVVKLSGGQRKRLSIAVEYIGNPALFFLDEPDSGLDGTMARQLMENLRTIADEGRIVLVISHSPDRAFELFDKVIVLAKSSEEEGRLVFYGSPKKACAFFEVSELEGIMRRINYPEEGGEGLADLYIRRFEERR